MLIAKIQKSLTAAMLGSIGDDRGTDGIVFNLHYPVGRFDADAEPDASRARKSLSAIARGAIRKDNISSAAAWR